MNSYSPLHVHSIYSIRDSIAKIPELLDRAKEIGVPAMALTEHGTLASALEFYVKAKDIGIKPIMGMEAYIATRHRTQKIKGIDKYYHLTLLVMNKTGWQNLVRLTSESYEEDNFYHKPRIDRELLKKYNEGLICLSGCVGGNLSSTIMKNLNLTFDIDEDFIEEKKQDVCFKETYEEHIQNSLEKVIKSYEKTKQEYNVKDLRAEVEKNFIDEYNKINTCQCAQCNPIANESFEDVIKWHKDVFGDRYYLEVQDHNMGIEDKINDVIFEMAKKYNIKVVATGDTHFVNEEDEKAHDLMIAIRGKMTIDDPKMVKAKYPGNGYNLLNYNQMALRFPGREDVLTNTLEIAERCNMDFNLGDFRLPHIYDVKIEDDIFKKEVYTGLKKRFGENLSPEILSRAEEEINTIIQMTFPSYFLMISDFINYSRNNNIPVGPGRGSAAGSIVAYALGITNINPLDYNLSFSRFLNKGRASVPVINFNEYPIEEWKNK